MLEDDGKLKKAFTGAPRTALMYGYTILEEKPAGNTTGLLNASTNLNVIDSKFNWLKFEPNGVSCILGWGTVVETLNFNALVRDTDTVESMGGGGVGCTVY